MRHVLLWATLLAPRAALGAESTNANELHRGAPGAAPGAVESDRTDVALRRWRAGVSSTSAFGISHGSFFNQLAGGRLEYRFTETFAFGGVVSYANLEGKMGRAHNVLAEAMLAYRLPGGDRALGVPLQLGLGFLPKNGPTLRLGIGLDWAITERLAVEVIPLQPMLWVSRERPELALCGSLGAILAL